MGSLLRYFATGEGCDVILICSGEWFFVHKTIIAAKSPILKKGIPGEGVSAPHVPSCLHLLTRRLVLWGEAFMLSGMTPEVLGRVLAFIYRGDIPESYQRLIAFNPAAHLPLDKKFPGADEYLTAMNGKPTTIKLNDGTTKVQDATTNKEKWPHMLGEQAALAQPYPVLSCENLAEVMLEIHVYSVAGDLEMPSLEATAMGKVSAWFETQLQTGLPVSNGFRACASYILRGDTDFVKPFLSACTRYLPVIEADDVLCSLIEETHPLAWTVMCSARALWKSESKQLQEALDTSKEKLQKIESSHPEPGEIPGDLEEVLKSQVEAMSRSLAEAKRKNYDNRTAIQQLEQDNKKLKREALEEKASALSLHEAKPRTEGGRAPRDPREQRAEWRYHEDESCSRRFREFRQEARGLSEL